jgi:hypothetical protein
VNNSSSKKSEKTKKEVVELNILGRLGLHRRTLHRRGFSLLLSHPLLPLEPRALLSGVSWIRGRQKTKPDGRTVVLDKLED